MSPKFFMAAAASLACAAAFGDAVTSSAVSSNVLGIVQVARPSAKDGEVAVGVPFAAADGGSPLSVDKLLVDGYGEEDDVRIWNAAGGRYDGWSWENGWTVIGSSGSQADPAPAAETFVAPGKAFWFRNESGSDSGVYTNLVLAGVVTNGVKSFVEAGDSSNPKLNLIINPFGAQVDLLAKIGDGAAAGDQIQIIGDTRRYTYKGGQWGYMGKTSIKIGTTTLYKNEFVAAPAITLSSGKAFWYISCGGTPSFAW